MTPMEKVEALLAEQKRLKSNTVSTTTVTQDKLEEKTEKGEVTLPTLATPLSGLSLINKAEEKNKQNLIARFSVDQEDYKDINLSEDEFKKIRKVTGKMGSGVAATVPVICRGETCSVKEKCLEGNSLILTEGLSTKKIKDIVVGDKVYSVTKDLKLEKKVVTDINTTEGKALYEIKTTTGNKLKITANHPLLMKVDNESILITLESGLQVGDTIYLVDELDTDKMVDLISEGDCLLGEIESITFNKVDTVYDITVKDNENYIANSFVVHNCPYYNMGKAPVGRDCLVEVSLAEYWTDSYIDDLNIDLSSISEVHYLSRLVEISILENRLGNYLSINQPDLVMDVVTAVDDEGNEITNKASSIAFDQKERLDKQKMKILESLSSTRKEKLKLKQEEVTVSQNTTLVGLSQKLAELTKDFNNTNNMKIVGSQ